MSRLVCFLAGLVVGTAGFYVAHHYHLVRADEGFHLVPKVSSHLGEAYVDIRDFDLADWEDHKLLAAAIIQAGKPELLKDAANQSLLQSLDSVVDVLQGS